jgi:hypothetical protein
MYCAVASGYFWKCPAFNNGWCDQMDLSALTMTQVVLSFHLIPTMRAQEMAAQEKAANVKPFVPAGVSTQRGDAPQAFLSQAPTPPQPIGAEGAGGSGSVPPAAGGTKPWRSGGPPKQVKPGCQWSYPARLGAHTPVL